MKQILLMIAVVALVGCKFTNTLGMKFVPVPGTDVQFSIWETRGKDYAAYAAANAGVDEGWKKPGFKQEDTHPVVKVSWNEAQAFCEWLTKKELAEGKIKAGQKYRLPTDAEWSVAVGLGKEKGNTPREKQMGIKDVYPWGKEWPPPKGAGNYPKSLNVDKFDYTAPVGSFASNKDGLHDMGGNVWEWCEDKYSPATTHRVLRGASWRNRTPAYLLSSVRRYSTPGVRNGSVGFRCVLVGGSGGRGWPVIPSASYPTSDECPQVPVRIHTATSCPRPSRPRLGPQGLCGFWIRLANGQSQSSIRYRRSNSPAPCSVASPGFRGRGKIFYVGQ